jgi:hypothetical protein
VVGVIHNRYPGLATTINRKKLMKPKKPTPVSAGFLNIGFLGPQKVVEIPCKVLGTPVSVSIVSDRYNFIAEVLVDFITGELAGVDKVIAGENSLMRPRSCPHAIVLPNHDRRQDDAPEGPGEECVHLQQVQAASNNLQNHESQE